MAIGLIVGTVKRPGQGQDVPKAEFQAMIDLQNGLFEPGKARQSSSGGGGGSGRSRRYGYSYQVEGDLRQVPGEDPRVTLIAHINELCIVAAAHGFGLELEGLELDGIRTGTRSNGADRATLPPLEGSVILSSATSSSTSGLTLANRHNWISCSVRFVHRNNPHAIFSWRLLVDMEAKKAYLNSSYATSLGDEFYYGSIVVTPSASPSGTTTQEIILEEK